MPDILTKSPELTDNDVVTIHGMVLECSSLKNEIKNIIDIEVN